MNDKELRRLVKEVAEKTKGNIVVADFAVAVARKAVLQAKEQILKQHAPKPRELAPCGTGALLGEQQFCFEKGWKEGIAAFRKLIRSNVEHNRRTAASSPGVRVDGPVGPHRTGEKYGD